MALKWRAEYERSAEVAELEACGTIGQLELSRISSIHPQSSADRLEQRGISYQPNTETQTTAEVATSTKSHLIDLPTELLEWIAAYVPPDGLLCLRSTCADLARRLTSTFSRVLFKERCYVLLNEQSITTLYEISHHEVHSKSVEHIRFSLMMLLSRDEYNRRIFHARKSVQEFESCHEATTNI